MSDSIKDAQELIDNASLFIFIPGDNSSGTDANGEEYDYSFATENGRVSWIKNQDGNFLTTFNIFDNADKQSESRILTEEQLKNWFYAPTTKHYEENILNVPVQ